MIDAAPILKRIERSVHATDPDATVILYGSYARGEQHKDSDIDLLILLDQDKVTYDDRKRIGNPLYHLELETGILISPVILTRHTWETKNRATLFYNNVIREGKQL